MDVKILAHLSSRRAGNYGVLEYWGKSMERWSNGIAVPRGVNVEQGCETWGILNFRSIRVRISEMAF